MPAKAPRVLAHRGASGHACENSLAAFREAVRLGADGVELDIHTTADGSLLIHHDPVIRGVGPIASHRLEAIRATPLPNGEPIPILEEALAVLGGLEVWIEVKALPASADLLLLGAIERAPTPSRCAVHSFDHRIVARLGARRPALRRGVLSASYPIDPVGPMVAAGASALWQASELIDAELVDAVHRHGGEVIAWTVNDPALARRLAALGVDALCGNYPERLRLG
jgi:glycerophosphoryl diester phosphodiesterase